ncbi:hypothetical protein GO730_02045 [Spirosoma sp. HMF3257]|uniref:DUF4864 domain-containing protein n=1 Tax=Spirosoma telluris TaxID=2183553 RepID=A0A327NFD8_9BACT|nr:hypothetical protein [Spirosoma telluris]RAI73503.1 hypothetical protein HMF3257_02010 [Spirosoma telluris]
MRPVDHLLGVVMLLWLSTFAQAQVQLQQLPDHPRLFANAARVIKVKNQTDSVSRQLRAYIQQTAERALTAERIVYPMKGFKFGPMRTVQGRILTLAMHYRLTGDQRFLNRAAKSCCNWLPCPIGRLTTFWTLAKGHWRLVSASIGFILS